MTLLGFRGAHMTVDSSDATCRALVGVASGWQPAVGEPQTTPYIRALLDCGAIPLTIDAGLSEEKLAELVANLDGVLLTGGKDVEPCLYGEERLPCCGESDSLRDTSETALVRAAIGQDKPLLAICRGIQVLNVAMGGSLYQDISEQVRGSLKHRNQARQELVHAVRLAPGSIIATCLGATGIQVNSLHHQALKRVADRLRPVGWSEDGIVEAVEMPGKRFVIGVQWHPEELVTVIGHARKLFESFLAAAFSPACRPQ